MNFILYVLFFSLSSSIASSLPPSSTSTLPSTLCFPSPNNKNCLSWTIDIDKKNITFTSITSPDSSIGLPIWSAWGLPSVNCGNMWPAHIWLILPLPNGKVRVEDRVTKSHSVPECVLKVPQLSYTLEGTIDSDGTVHVTWTRPLIPLPLYQQPIISTGDISVISAYSLGANTFDFPLCSSTNLPFHTNVLNGVTVNFFNKVSTTKTSPILSSMIQTNKPILSSMIQTNKPILSSMIQTNKPLLSSMIQTNKPILSSMIQTNEVSLIPSSSTFSSSSLYSGLASIITLCGNSCASIAHFKISTGSISFPSSTSPSFYPLLTAFDIKNRIVHTLSFNNSQTNRSSILFLASISVDTSTLLGTCETNFVLNDGFDLSNVNFAYDSITDTVIIASCIDDLCIAPLNITAIHPKSCSSQTLASLPVQEVTIGGSGAIDPFARIFLFTVARPTSGLALIAFNISSKTILRIIPETQDTPYIQSLVFDTVSRLVYGLAFTTAGYSQPSLVSINASTGKLKTIGQVNNCNGALPDSLAVSDDGTRLFFIGSSNTSTDSTILYSIYTANATIASSVSVQDGTLALGDAPNSLFWVS